MFVIMQFVYHTLNSYLSTCQGFSLLLFCNFVHVGQWIFVLKCMICGTGLCFAIYYDSVGTLSNDAVDGCLKFSNR